MTVRVARVFALVFACAIAASPSDTRAEPVDTKRLPQATLDTLKQSFVMPEVLSLVSASSNRSASKAYLQARQTRFKFMETQKQGPMVVDGYSVQDMASPIIGYSLFYHSDNGPLVIADASVNPIQKDAVAGISKLIAASLDSISNPDGSKMYFLGIHDLDSSRVLKIMVRAASTPMGPDYALRYAVSDR
ncbi:MAG: hypothetical protein M3495_00360 [Pseudomonadota bacterium]|nr:hypothetical protein [Pseudomonadota bacterium]